MKDHTTLCLHAEFVATHAKPPLSLISHLNKEHDVDFFQLPDISRSHLYRGTFPWTPTTAIYRAYTVHAPSDQEPMAEEVPEGDCVHCLTHSLNPLKQTELTTNIPRDL